MRSTTEEGLISEARDEDSVPIVTVFRSRLREENLDEYERTAGEILRMAQSMPGFLELKTFVAEDGERLSLVTFESMSDHRAWRDHPEHREAQRLGREVFYSEYRIVVCEVAYEREFRKDDIGSP